MELSSKESVLALSWEHIESFSLPTRKGKVAGVYMLVNHISREIDYVGQSVNIGHRLLAHRFYDPEYYLGRDLFILRIAERVGRRYVEARAIYFLHPNMNERNGIGLKLSDNELQVGYDNVFNK